MSHIHTFNSQAQGPEILERLSELEQRDKAATGRVRTEAMAGGRIVDPRGYAVLNTTGHPVGKVEEVFVDPNTLQPGWVLLHYQKFMNFNTKSLLVPWSELRVNDQTVQTRPSEQLPEEASEAEEMTDEAFAPR